MAEFAAGDRVLYKLQGRPERGSTPGVVVRHLPSGGYVVNLDHFPQEISCGDTSLTLEPKAKPKRTQKSKSGAAEAPPVATEVAPSETEVAPDGGDG